MLIVLVASLLGVSSAACSASLLPIAHNIVICVGAGAILGCCGWFCRERSTASVSTRITAGVAIGLLAFGWAGLCGNYYQAVATENGKWQVEVVNLPEVKYGSVSFKARLICRYVDNEVAGECSNVVSHPFGLPAYVMLSVSDVKLQKPFELFIPGRGMRADLRFQVKEYKGNPGFDRAKWFVTERIIGAATIQSFEPDPSVSGSSINYLRHRLKEWLSFDSKVDQSSFSHLALEPVIMALTLGDRSDLSDEHWKLFRATGTTHLMAISGLHLGLLSGWVFWFIRALVGRIRYLNQQLYPQFIASLFALTSAALYGCLVGFPLPTQRAFIMLIFAYVGIMSGRPKMILNALAFALLLILVLQPFAVLSASLWLSFSAITLVFYVIANRINQLSGKYQPITMALHLQFCFFVVMAPLSFYFFGGVSTNSFVSNILAIPIVTAILLPVSVLNVLVGLLSPEWVYYLGEFNYWVLDSLLCGLQWINQEFFAFQFLDLSMYGLVLAVIASMLVFYPAGWQIRAAGLGVLVLLLIPTTQQQVARVEFYNTNHTFLSFSGIDNSVLVVDETPGRRWDEASILNTQFPETRGFNTTHWQDSWAYNQWVIDSISRSSSRESVGLCGLGERDFNNHLNLSGVKQLQLLPLDESNLSCLAAFQWQGKNWLLGGGVSQDKQSLLIETGKLMGFVEGLAQIDYVLLRGDYFQGAFLNLFKEATFIVWNKLPLSSAMVERFSVRGLSLVELVGQGATSLALHSDSEQMQLLVSKRFYHVSRQ